MHRNIINTEVSKILINTTMFELMWRFHRSHITIQRGIRHILAIKNARFFALRLMWDRLENSSISKLRRLSKAKIDKNDIMFKQKEEQIRKYYFSQVKVYLENVKIYHEKRKDIDVQFDADLKELEFEKMFTGKPLMIEKEPKYPKAPVLLLYSNQHILKKQVLQLISNQSQANNTNLKPKTRQSIQMNLKPTSTLQIFDAIGRRHYSLYYIKE